MNNRLFVACFVLVLSTLSCEKNQDSEYREYLVARPLTVSMEAFLSDPVVIGPQPIEQSGKIYAYGNYIFVNEPYKGVHIIDNSNPEAPVKTGFITIPGNVDISVKQDYLYADSLQDLIVLDISDLNNIQQVSRLKDVLEGNVFWPLEAEIVETDGWNSESQILVGWQVVSEQRLIAETETDVWRNGIAMAEMAATDSGTGEGGSMARFKIVDDFLYAVGSHFINVFDISNLELPKALEAVFAGFDIETIFNQGTHLFLGSKSGMYIYDITAPASPQYISEFQHGTACDPVVVDGDYAYVTLRGGNECGATESGLFVIDIRNIETPELAKSYPLDGPYGLGVKDSQLFVCDGDSGLRVYDKTDVLNLKELAHFDDVVTYDVIPLATHLLMVGDGMLFQYEYQDTGLSLLSSISLKD
ncbi:MAG: hypothetical protein RLZZ241_2200 [Bacteroidota bacterium]|jgi:hypothetical protein